MTKNYPGDYTLRCRKCEGKLGKPMSVRPVDYGLVENEHGAVTRTCLECRQRWLSFVTLLPNMGMKVVQKPVDTSA